MTHTFRTVLFFLHGLTVNLNSKDRSFGNLSAVFYCETGFTVLLLWGPVFRVSCVVCRVSCVVRRASCVRFNDQYRYIIVIMIVIYFINSWE